MQPIKTFSQYREGGSDLIDHEKVITTHKEAIEIIDSYPWLEELELFEKYGEGGAIFFMFENDKGQSAEYQFTPTEKNAGELDIIITLKSGWLGLFGRKVIRVDLGLVSIAQAKLHIKDLFEHSIESLYQKYQSN